MTNDKCCSGGKLCGVIVFLIGLVVGGALVGVLVAYGQLDFLQGKIFGAEHKQPAAEVKTSGVMFELDDKAPGAWTQLSETSELSGAWVEIANGAWTQMTADTLAMTEDGDEVTVPNGAWTQIVSDGMVKFLDTPVNGAWTQLQNGAWTQLTADTEVLMNGAWTQLAAGTKLQLVQDTGVLMNGAWTQ